MGAATIWKGRELERSGYLLKETIASFERRSRTAHALGGEQRGKHSVARRICRGRVLPGGELG